MLEKTSACILGANALGFPVMSSTSTTAVSTSSSLAASLLALALNLRGLLLRLART